MPLSIKFTVPESLKGNGKIGQIVQMKSSILLVGGKALQELLKDWMRELSSSRSKHGSNHFNPSGVLEPVVNENTVSVPITIPGITRALHDIVIRPVEANALAIPVNESAYGMQPREYNNVHPKGTPEALFRPKDKDYLAKTDAAGNLVVMYILRKSVHQSQDSTLLPPDEQMNKAFSDSVHDAIEAILNS